jgi:hypothetical protein
VSLAKVALVRFAVVQAAKDAQVYRAHWKLSTTVMRFSSTPEKSAKGVAKAGNELQRAAEAASPKQLTGGVQKQ